MRATRINDFSASSLVPGDRTRASPGLKSGGAGFQTRVNAPMYELRALALVYVFSCLLPGFSAACLAPEVRLSCPVPSCFHGLLGTLLAVWKSNRRFDPIQLRVRPRHLVR